MRGYITKRGKDSYSLAISMGKDPNSGKYKYTWITVRGNKTDAEKRLAEVLHQKDTGTFIKPSKTTVGQYLEVWLNDHKLHLSPRGFERYQDIVKQHLIPDFGQLTLDHLKPEHIQKHYTSCLNKGLSPGTIAYHHAVIHVALKTAVKRGLLYRNPADAVDPPCTRRKEMKIWTEDQVNIFVEAAKDNRYYILFYTALFTGMRRSELLGLKWEDVDLIFGQICVRRSLHHLKNGSYVFTEPKSVKSRRTIALTPSNALLLKEYWENQSLERSMLGTSLSANDLVFCTVDGKPLRPNTITRAWEVLAAQCGLPVIRLHDARHTHASIMLKQGIHPKIVQERLGHSSIEMTLDTYSHVVPGLQEAAAKRFDDFVTPKSAVATYKN